MPASTAASAARSEPVALTSWLRSGFASDARRLSHAMWTTTEAPRSTRCRQSRSRTSPTTTRAPAASASRKFPRAPTLRSSRTVTSAPTSISSSTTWLPMNPAPPVTTTRAPASFTSSVDATPAEDGRQRVDQQPDVLPERPVRHVEVVELHHLLERDVRPAEHLPEAGDARRQVEPSPPPAGDVLVDVGRHRTRA